MIVKPRESVLTVLNAVLGKPGEPIALHEPRFTGRESSLVTACIESTFVSSVGRYVTDFEFMLSSIVGAKSVVALVNGTVALQVALHVSGVEAGDEVFVPALTFVGTANAISHCGAVPHLVDSCPKTLGICTESLESYLDYLLEPSVGSYRNRFTGRRIGALVPVHVFGHVCDMEHLIDIGHKYRIPIVEDAAESLGSFYGDRHTGTLGKIGTFSFNGNKIITTGGGGAVCTQDEVLGAHIRHLTSTAKLPHRWAYEHDSVAWNFRMPNLNAALGCAQLERLESIILTKRLLAKKYREQVSIMDDIEFVDEPMGTTSNYWLNTVRLLNVEPGELDRTLEETHKFGYLCRPAWQLLNESPMYSACPTASLSSAQKLAGSLINLPSSPHLFEIGLA